jgi:hypothetical protein
MILKNCGIPVICWTGDRPGNLSPAADHTPQKISQIETFVLSRTLSRGANRDNGWPLYDE